MAGSVLSGYSGSHRKNRSDIRPLSQFSLLWRKAQMTSAQKAAWHIRFFPILSFLAYALAAALIVGSVYLVLRLAIDGLWDGNSMEVINSPIVAVSFLKVIFLQSELYVSILFMFLAWTIWRINRYWALHKTLGDTKEEHVSETSVLKLRDWILVKELRIRSYILRVRADLALGGIVLLVFCTIYFILFLLPHVLRYDRSVFFSGKILHEYGADLQALVDGLYWTRVSTDVSTGEKELPQSKSEDDDAGEGTASSVRFSELFTLLVYSVDATSTEADHYKLYGTAHLGHGERWYRGHFNATGRVGYFFGRSGTVLTTNDGGASWTPSNLPFTRETRIDAGDISADGSTSAFSFDESKTIHIGNVGEDKWHKIKVSSFQDGEFINDIVLNQDGSSALFVGNKGSISQYSTNTNELRHMGDSVQKENGVRISLVAQDDSGSFVIAAGSDGKLFTVRKHNFKLKMGEISMGRHGDGEGFFRRIVMSGDGSTALVAMEGGSLMRGRYFFLENDDGTWRVVVSGVLEMDEFVESLALSDDGSTAVVTGTKGSVHIRNDMRDDFESVVGIEFEEGERVSRMAVSGSGDLIYLVGNAGSQYFSVGKPRTWVAAESKRYTADNRIFGVGVFEDENRFYVRQYDTRLYERAGNDTWNLVTPKNRLTEKFVGWTTARNELSNSRLSVLVGEQGSVYLRNERIGRISPHVDDWEIVTSLPVDEMSTETRVVSNGTGTKILIIDPVISLCMVLEKEDGVFGSTWTMTNWKAIVGDSGGLSAKIINLESREHANEFLLTLEDGRQFVLKEYVQLEPWREMDGDLIVDALEKAGLYDTKLYTNIEKEAKKNVSTDTARDAELSLQISRLVTLTILLFLVHVFVRIYQYSLRLSAFWDSRADAILAFQTFSNANELRFDRLVEALGPDEYDFKNRGSVWAPRVRVGHSGVRT